MEIGFSLSEILLPLTAEDLELPDRAGTARDGAVRVGSGRSGTERFFNPAVVLPSRADFVPPARREPVRKRLAVEWARGAFLVPAQKQTKTCR